MIFKTGNGRALKCSSGLYFLYYVALDARKVIKAHKREWCTLAQNGTSSLRQDFSELGGSELQHDFQDGKWEER